MENEYYKRSSPRAASWYRRQVHPWWKFWIRGKWEVVVFYWRPGSVGRFPAFTYQQATDFIHARLSNSYAVTN